MGGTIGALALADFRERRRRPAYLVVLLGTLALGLLAAPVGAGGAGGASTWQIFQVSGYRGLYTSGYVGTVTALGGAVWLALAGFGITRGTVTGDERSGVGQILAATPMTRVSYLLGKFCGNLLLLGSMLLALAVTAVGVQLLKGESYSVDAVRLLLPFVLVTLPLLAFVAACAVLFDTVPGLRGGVGALVWFVVWLVGVTASQASGGYDLLSMSRIGASMRRAIESAGHPADAVRFGVGLTSGDKTPVVFEWSGLGPGDLGPGVQGGGDLGGGVLGGGPLANAGLLTVGSLVVCLLAVPWFRRFDPSGRVNAAGVVSVVSVVLPAGSAGAAQDEPAPAAGPGASFGLDPALMTPPRMGSSFLPALVGELRVLLRWMRLWWVGALALAVIAAIVPIEDVSHPVLAVSMLWPVLLWSRMGNHAGAGSIDDLLAACPAAGRRLLAALLGGIGVALAVSVVPVVRLTAAGDTGAAVAALAGALVVPSLAVLCGIVSRGPRLFQALYPLLWYAMSNRIAEVDYLGVVPDRGPAPVAVAAAAVVLALAALGVDGLRRANR
ncbi:ABC transporter permease subunit [Kitasatospora sp. NPDC056446]|uniref:ABC transporter permease subunit n=1 Tax=Kitasatospora sp. NPDC056446 TaxID=3345819 RepID=UPI0036A5A93F